MGGLELKTIREFRREGLGRKSRKWLLQLRKKKVGVLWWIDKLVMILKSDRF